MPCERHEDSFTETLFEDLMLWLRISYGSSSNLIPTAVINQVTQHILPQ